MGRRTNRFTKDEEALVKAVAASELYVKFFRRQAVEKLTAHHGHAAVSNRLSMYRNHWQFCIGDGALDEVSNNIKMFVYLAMEEERKIAKKDAESHAKSAQKIAFPDMISCVFDRVDGASGCVSSKSPDAENEPETAEKGAKL